MNNFLKLIYLLFFFNSFFHAIAFSQSSVYGVAVDKSNTPQSGVKIYLNSDSMFIFKTNEDGKFQFLVEPNLKTIIRFKLDSDELEKRTVTVKSNETLDLGKIRLNLFNTEINANQEDPDITKLPSLKGTYMPRPNFEAILALTTAASSNNELTSNYNVRGGNYDENLIYVNGFLINRPLLTRTGQQEGLSFIHSALVSDISFSAGGFDAQYGDKLSSVLDIKYTTPTSFKASSSVSLLGVEGHIENAPTSRFSFLIGARYRANGYLLNSLPAKGSYKPRFLDAQMVLNYRITEKLEWQTMFHTSSNQFNFAPVSQETKFGTFSQNFSFKVYFEGQERSRFLTTTAATALKYAVNKKLQLDFYGSIFRSNERESFDILGEYYINELENNPADDQFGDSVATLGIGGFLNHARNQLIATVASIYHNGTFKIAKNKKLLWGVSAEHDSFNDKISEWNYVDSAGYNAVLGNPQQLELFKAIKVQNKLNYSKFVGFTDYTWSKVNFKEPTIQTRKKITDTISSPYTKITVSGGVRIGYTTINNEPYITPRFSVTYSPNRYFARNKKLQRRDTKFRFASGLYYQPPFYREFRNQLGQLNTNVKAQKSMHLVAGNDYFFYWLGREKPFKLTSEMYFKYMWDLNPYKIENVRTIYSAKNNAIGYATGIDAQLYGEFIKGIQSFFKVGILRTREDIKDDFYKEYFNSKGEKIIFGFTEDNVIVDSIVKNPKFIPRPTDQLLNLGILFQDQMPRFEALTISLGLQYGSRLPFGPPNKDRFADTLRQKYYFRTDLGIGYDFLYGKDLSKKKTIIKKLSEFRVYLEVFNLMGINNVLNMQWVRDVNANFYAIPNYLTQRRFNLKFVVRW